MRIPFIARKDSGQPPATLSPARTGASADVSRRRLLMTLTTAPLWMGCQGLSYASYPSYGYDARPPALPPTPPILLIAECDWSWEQDSYIRLVNWYLRELLGSRNRLQLRTSDAPALTDRPAPCGDSFHDMGGSIYVIQGVRLTPVRSFRYGFHIGVTEYVRADAEVHIPAYKDLNTVELRTIWSVKEKWSGPMLFPCGLRRPPRWREVQAFERRCLQRGLDPSEQELQYCRPFNDGQNSHLAFGLRSRLSGATDLLI